MRSRVFLFAAIAASLVAVRSASAQVEASVRDLLRTGDSAYAVHDRVAARAAYRAAVARDSSASSRAVYRLAVILAEDGEFATAIALHVLYTTLEPNDAEGALGLARTYAWAGHTEDALDIYRRVLAAQPDYRDAALGAGQVLAWAGRYGESVAVYRDWLSRRPGDRDVGLALARTLAWWGGGHLREAEQLYDSLRTSDADAEARKGLALVAAWRGDLARSERIWRELTDAIPNDAEVWTGLAQVLRWRGQPFEARDALQRALAIAPAHRDARSQRRWLDAELAAAVRANVVSSGDSDDNRAQLLSLDAAAAPWRDVSLRVDGVLVRAEFAGAERTSQTAHVRATWRVPWGSGDWRARFAVGVNRRPDVGASGEARLRALGQIALGGRLSSRANAEVRVGRSVIDETVALIVAGIHLTTAEADWESQLGDRWSVSAALSAGDISSDSSSNTRIASTLGTRWSLTHGRSIGLTVRKIQHAREARDGYFSPRHYTHAELNARARHGRDLGWTLAGDGGVGLQQVDYRGQRNTQPTQRLTGSIGYVWAPGVEWSFSATLANVATTFTSAASGYRYGSLSLGGRVPLR